MNLTQAGPSNGQRPSVPQDFQQPPPQKRRRTSTSHASPSTGLYTPACESSAQPRIKQEPREHWVEIEAQYVDEEDVLMDAASSAQRVALPPESSSLSSASAIHSVKTLPDAAVNVQAGASAAQSSPGGTQKLVFPSAGKLWPLECEAALIRYVAKHDRIRQWAESGGERSGLDEGLQRFIDMHGLTVSVHSLEKRLKNWGQQYSGLNKRLSSPGRNLRTSLWTSAYDKSYLECAKFSERMALWHDLVYLHWQSPDYVSPSTKRKRQARDQSLDLLSPAATRVSKHQVRDSSPTSTLAGPSGARARRSSSRITSSLPSTIVASGAPKSSAVAPATPKNASPATKSRPKKQLKQLKTNEAEENVSSLAKLVKQQAAEIAELKALMQEQTQLLKAQGAQLKRQDRDNQTRLTQQHNSLEFIKRQLKAARDREEL